MISLTVDQLLDASHYRSALSKLNAAPADSAVFQLLLSRAELGLGQLEPALQSAEKAIASDERSNSKDAVKRAALHVQVAAVAGRIAEHASMFKQLSWAKRVKKELEQALNLDPKNADALYGLMLYNELAPSFVGGDKAKAQALAEQLTAIAPGRGYLAQATLAHDRKNAAAEESFLQRAVEADPQSYDAHMALAVFAHRGEHPNAEVADLQTCQALYLEPTRVDAWQLLVELAADAQCLNEVNGLLYAARAFNPDDLSPAYHAAAALIVTGKNLDVAEKLLNQYLETSPEGGAPSAASTRYQLALIREKQGLDEQARELLRVALKEDPSLDEARKDLKRLEQASSAP